MLPTAVSEVLEAAGKLCFGLCFALLARARGASAAGVAAAAICGITAGMALSALWLAATLVFFAVCDLRTPHNRPQALPSRRSVLGSLCRVALPITLSASVMSVVSLLDTALISGRLQAAGFAPAVANAMYSSYGNLAIPLYNLVPSLLSPLTLALMPLLGACFAKGDRLGGEAAFGSALRLTALCSIPAAMGLAVFARPVLALLYGKGQGAVDVAAPLLSLLALAIPLAALITLLGAALQALGHTVIPVVAMGAGALVKLALECVLLSVPGVHIFGAPISTLACNITVLAIEAAVLARVLPFRLLAVRDLLRPFLAALCSVGGGAALYAAVVMRAAAPIWLMPAVLCLVAVLFLLLALRFRAICVEDLRSLPHGERICALFIKCRLLKEVKYDT
jgi:stage V sporulation protein B